ncbi:MAG: hypothetical protein ACKOT0_11800 [bacterium]
MSGRLVIIGSGETAPTMVKVHREVIGSSGPGAATMMDTPFGFQVNADDLTDKILEYFRDSVGSSLDVVRWRSRDEAVTERERALALLSRASWAFAGPGSPTYALRQWEGTPIPGALRDLVDRGGTLVMGSAAAVTVGAYAVPVYEIYKVGIEPHWLEGLDLLGSLTGITAAVVPHYDNREGGRHDTRYCYLGEERLVRLEGALPEDIGVLGVDEHTAVILDRESRTATVQGVGGLTLRHRGVSTLLGSGESVSFDDISRALRGASVADGASRAPAHSVAAPTAEPLGESLSLRAEVDRLRAAFDACLAAGDADGALAATLELEDAIHAWSADTVQGDHVDRARAALRGMLVDLASAASTGLRDEREVLGPVVDVALAARQLAREQRDFAMSDLVRDRLAAAGIEVRDTPDGPEWSLAAG